MRRMIPQKDIEKLDSIKLLNDGKYTSIENEIVQMLTPAGSVSVRTGGYTNVCGDTSVAIGGDYSPAVGDYNYVLDIGADGFKFQHLNEDSEELETVATFGEDGISLKRNILVNEDDYFSLFNPDEGEELTILYDANDGYFRIHAGGTPSIKINNENILFEGLPTSNPGVAGALWNDNGILKISSGN